MKYLMIALLLVSGPALADSESDYQRGFDAFRRDDLFGAMQYLQPAAEQGHVKAQVLLAYILDKAEENEQALALYRKAAEAGSAEALMGMALMTAAGEGTPADPKAALALLEQSAEAGHAAAMKQLYLTYKNGLWGAKPDTAKAREWLQRAAAAGDPEAKRLLQAE